VCHSLVSATAKQELSGFLEYGFNTARTKILCNYGGIAEVDHPDRQQSPLNAFESEPKTGRSFGAPGSSNI